MNFQKEEETPNYQGKQDDIEGKRGLLHQFIPALKQGVLDSVQVQRVDEMVHCLSERPETREFCVSKGRSSTDTLEPESGRRQSGEGHREPLAWTYPEDIPEELYLNSEASPLRYRLEALRIRVLLEGIQDSRVVTLNVDVLLEGLEVLDRAHLVGGRGLTTKGLER